MSKSPAFQFYPKEWLSSMDIMLMTPEQEGAYIRLLCICWESGDCSIPDDDKQLSMLSRLGEGWFKGSSTVVRNKFISHPYKPGFLTNERLLKEANKQADWARKCSAGGKKSAEKRASQQSKTNDSKGSSRVVEGYLGNSTNYSSTLQSSVSNLHTPVLPPTPKRDDEVAKVRDWSAEFEEFWKAYPDHRKDNRYRTQSAWSAARLLLPPIKEVLGALAAFKSSKKWRDEQGKYVPAPHAWLEERRWQDAPAYSPKAKPAPKSEVDEADAFAWRAEAYPESLEVHPSAQSFPFKIWPESIRAEYRNRNNQLQAA